MGKNYHYLITLRELSKFADDILKFILFYNRCYTFIISTFIVKYTYIYNK